MRLANYVVTLDCLGRHVDAEQITLECLQVSRRMFGLDHPNTLASMANYAVTLENLGRFAEAQPVFLECVEISRRVFGADHPETLRHQANLEAANALAEAAG